MPDARSDGSAAPDIFHRNSMRNIPTKSETLVYIDDVEFIKGSASGISFGLNNCLIHTLQHALSIALESLVVDIPWVRSELKKQFPKTHDFLVTDHNYLDLGEHWKAVIDLLDLLGRSARQYGCDVHNRIHHRFFQIHCVDERSATLGFYEGDGSTKIYILNEGRAHFVPLIRRPHV